MANKMLISCNFNFQPDVCSWCKMSVFGHSLSQWNTWNSYCVCRRITRPYKTKQFPGLLPKDADHNPGVVLLSDGRERGWSEFPVRWSRRASAHALWQRYERLQELHLSFQIRQRRKNWGWLPAQLENNICSCYELRGLFVLLWSARPWLRIKYKCCTNVIQMLSCFILGRVKLLSAAGSKKFLLFPGGEWRVICYQKHLETTTTWTVAGFFVRSANFP